MNAMKILGLSIQMEEWNKQNKLPLYITNNYFIQKAIINNVQCLALLPQNELPPLSALKKQIKKIQNIEPLPVFLKLETLSFYRKESLISNGIPFMLLDKIVYLPFMATLLTNTNSHFTKVNEKLTMSAQLLFIWILYQNTDMFYISDAVEKLNFSNMTLTRAYRQLLATGLFDEHKDGRRIYLTTNYSKKDLFEKMQPYLKSPIIRSGYIEKKDIHVEMVESGESALSQYTLLNPPLVPTIAIDNANAKNLFIHNELINTDDQIRIEIWDYDPLLFSKNGQQIDLLSLVISLLDSEDERVELQREDLLIKLFNSQGGKL